MADYSRLRLARQLRGLVRITTRSRREHLPQSFVFTATQSGNQHMTKLKIIGAACLVAALATASPAMARGGHMGGGHMGGGGFHGGSHFAGGGFRGGRGGFGPGIAAGVIAGAAIGGLGYGYYGNSYAYDNGDNYAYGDNYAPAPYQYNNSGFVCQPGTYFRGEDGRTHLCQ
jgi:hypothetical protein